MQQILPFCDILIGNEAEAEAWASASGLPDTKDLSAIAKAIAVLPKSNPSRPRIVVITHGAESTRLVTSTDPDNVKIFPVQALKDEDIVDTNAAGDAFAGGFLGAYVAGKSLDECIEVGHKMGAMCVGQVRFLLLIQTSHLHCTQLFIFDFLGRTSIQMAKSTNPLDFVLRFQFLYHVSTCNRRSQQR